MALTLAGSALKLRSAFSVMAMLLSLLLAQPVQAGGRHTLNAPGTTARRCAIQAHATVFQRCKLLVLVAAWMDGPLVVAADLASVSSPPQRLHTQDVCIVHHCVTGYPKRPAAMAHSCWTAWQTQATAHAQALPTQASWCNRTSPTCVALCPTCQAVLSGWPARWVGSNLHASRSTRVACQCVLRCS
jgi:hypothetical protein